MRPANHAQRLIRFFRMSGRALQRALRRDALEAVKKSSFTHLVNNSLQNENYN